MLKRLITLTLALCMSIAAAQAQERAVPSILPKPTKMQMGNINSKFTIGPSTKVVCKIETSDMKFALRELNNIGKELFGKEFKKSSKIEGSNNIIIRQDASMKDEAYSLEITPENIIIKAKGASGVFYAVQTLKQIVPFYRYHPLNYHRCH